MEKVYRSMTKEYQTLGFKDDPNVFAQVKELWHDTTCKPKVISLQDAIDNNWISKTHWTNNCVVSEDILTYKVWYLYTDIRRNGLWSPPNGVMREHNIHFHPGPNRVTALCMANMYQVPIVIWDPLNKIDAPELSFDKWLSLFPEEKSPVWFSSVRKFIDLPEELFMLEAHLSQTGEPFDNMKSLVQSLFKNTKPKMINYSSSELNEYVHYDGDNHGVEIYVKDGQEFTLSDFDLCININDIDKRFENEKVIITVRD